MQKRQMKHVRKFLLDFYLIFVCYFLSTHFLRVKLWIN